MADRACQVDAKYSWIDLGSGGLASQLSPLGREPTTWTSDKLVATDFANWLPE
jgi:hypothetical protein